MATEIDNQVQHSYSFNVKLMGVPEIAETESKKPTLDTMNLCVRIFEAMGCNMSINDIYRQSPPSACVKRFKWPKVHHM